MFLFIFLFFVVSICSWSYVYKIISKERPGLEFPGVSTVLYYFSRAGQGQAGSSYDTRWKVQKIQITQKYNKT